MAKKILIGANGAWSIAKFRRNLIIALLAAGYEVVVIAPEDNYAQILINLGCRYIPLAVDCKGTNPLRDIALVTRIVKLLFIEKPDIFFTYTVKLNIYGTIAAKIAGIRCIAIITGLGYSFIHDNWISRIAQLLYRFALRFSQEIWFLNKDDKEVFLQHKIVDAKNSIVIPGEGIDLDYYSPHLAPNFSKEKIRILFIGRILWDKGVGEFVAAAKHLQNKYPQVEFCLLGSLDALNPSAIPSSQIDQWISEKAIHYFGVVDDVRSHIALADCIVLPSYREGIPQVLLEASSMEKPILATDVPGCRAVVDDGVTGFLCRPQDEVDLSLKIEKILGMTSIERTTMGKKGRQKVQEQFAQSLVIEHYLNTLLKILK